MNVIGALCVSIARLVSRLLFGRHDPRRVLAPGAVHLDDDLDGHDAIFTADWGAALGPAALEFDCWSLHGRATSLLHARHLVLRRALRRLTSAVVLVAALSVTGSLLDSRVVLAPVIAALVVTIAGLVAEAVALRRLQARWSRHPLLATIETLGGFEQLPLVWARNIPAAVRHRSQGVYAHQATELARSYHSWVGELAGSHVEEVLDVIETLSVEFHGSLGDLRRTATALVVRSPHSEHNQSLRR